MKRCWKARPHDLARVMAFKPDMIEIHVTSEDLEKPIPGKYTVPLAVHFPEYDGSVLVDPASLNETERLKASAFYQRCLDKTREWARSFIDEEEKPRTPKAIIHPGGWSRDPVKVIERGAIVEQFAKTMSELNHMGVDFLVENMPPFPLFYGGRWNCNIFMEPRECRDICLGMGWGFCFDACHAALWCRSVENNVTIEQYAQIVSPVIGHAHISGAKGVDGEGVSFEESDVDMAPIIRRLNNRNIGLSLEIWMSHQDDFKAVVNGWKRIDDMLTAVV